MAGTFYSIQEVMEKLGKSEEQIKELVKDGKLREFRDGAKLLYKTKEVDSMVTDEELAGESDSVFDFLQEGSGQVSLEPDDTDTSDASLGLGDTSPQEAEAEKTKAAEEREKTAALTDIAGLIDTDVDADVDADLGELTKADTSITSIGINVLSETNDDYALTDDTLGETNLAESTDELSTLGDDLNLDSAGSGSGLLDLSLQADDTSLGAVLDDILPAADQALDEGRIGDAEDEGEVEKIFDQPDEAGMPPAFAPASAARYVAPEPDAVDNACGIAMFLPLIALIYATVVVVATFRGIVPAALTSIEGTVWYIAGGMAVAAIAIIGIAALVAGKKASAKKKDVYQRAAAK